MAGQCRTYKIQHLRNPYSRKNFAREKKCELFCENFVYFICESCSQCAENFGVCSKGIVQFVDTMDLYYLTYALIKWDYV